MHSAIPNKKYSAINLMSWIILNKMNFLRCLIAALLSANQVVFASGSGYANEEEKRSVDISLSIFPRVIVVDNHFRSKKQSKVEVNVIANEDVKTL